jgi:Cdc6-like AAA superfamily ATPase
MDITLKQLEKVKKHYEALEEYKNFIEKMEFDFTKRSFESLDTMQKAVLEAYLKRFASLQDYLGAKVFRTLLDNAGISYRKMSEVLTLIEKEEIVSLDRWIELRTLRNNLEHDYSDELEETLEDLKICVENFSYLQDVTKRVFAFARRYNENIPVFDK